MGRGPPSFRIRTVSVHEQAAFIRQLWPNFVCEVHGGLLVCQGEVRPTDISRVYRVRLTYRAKYRPKVKVEDPPLRRRPSEPDVGIPHTFNQSQEGKETPCLHRTTDWSSDMRLANTVIPWLYEWLMFYELWHVTGEWYGGGVDHNGRKEP